MAVGASISWLELPDYARVAMVLAGAIAAGGLAALLARLRGAAGQSRVAADKSTGERRRRVRQIDHRAGTKELSMSENRPEPPPGGHEELPTKAADPVLRLLHQIMHLATYVLAIAMVVVILEGVVSVIYTLYQTMSRPPFFMVPNIVETFGAFLVVLIAYEIFANITLYIRSDVFPVKLVVATAVMAVARKIIVLDMDDYSALDLIGIGAVVLGLGISYWLISLADARSGPANSGTRTDG